jgi:acyl carrier protein
MTELEKRIIDLIAEKMGTERGLVEHDSALAQDIGMDGDDAVEFFLEFGDKFHVDLTALKPHWHQHFKSEGCLGAPPLGCGIVIAVAIVAGCLIHIAVKRVPAWASIIALVVLLGWFCRKLFNYYGDDRIPVTVQDLVDGANAGKWVKRYEQL